MTFLVDMKHYTLFTHQYIYFFLYFKIFFSFSVTRGSSYLGSFYYSKTLLMFSCYSYAVPEAFKPLQMSSFYPFNLAAAAKAHFIWVCLCKADPFREAE